MSTSIAIKDDKILSQSDQVFAMLGTALDKGLNTDAIEKLVNLQERILAKNAEREYISAMTRFQSNCPPIAKNKKATVTTAGGGNYSYEYATLDHIAETIAPLLELCGLSYTFDSSLSDGLVRVVCTLSHNGGHSKQSEFTAPVDQGMKVGAAQKVASALTYARRYALVSALGLTTTGDDDDDGRTASASPKQTRIDKERMQRVMIDILSLLDSDDGYGLKQVVEELKEDEQMWVWQFFSHKQKENIRKLLNSTKPKIEDMK